MYTFGNTIAKKLLPGWMYAKLIGRWNKEGLKKYTANTGWAFTARIVSYAVSFFTVAIVARYLGPENLGRLSYAQSYVALFSIFASLGLNEILYRDLIAKPEEENKILGSVFVLRMVAAILTFTATAIASFFTETDPALTFLILIIAISTLVSPIGIFGTVFQSRVLAKYPAYTRMTAAFLIPALKFIVIFFHGGLYYFAAIIAFEAIFSSTTLLYFYKKHLHGKISDWSFSFIRARAMLQSAWPLIIVGAMGYVYGRIDQVMVQHFFNSTEVGYYSAAVTLTEAWAFIPGLFISSLFPAIAGKYMADPSEYFKRFRALSLAVVGSTTALAVCVILASPVIVHILYGKEFLPTIPLLAVYSTTNILLMFFTLLKTHFTIRDTTKETLMLTVLGAIANILLNMLLIPRFGAMGAVYGTIATYIIIVLGALLSHRTRHELRRMFLTLP